MATAETIQALEEIASSTIVRDRIRVSEPKFRTDRGVTCDSEGDIRQSYNYMAEFEFDRYISDRVKRLRTDYFTLLDIGCGEGRFLTEVSRICRNIAVFGITYKLYPTRVPRNRIILGGLTDSKILEKIPTGSIDLIASACCLYSARPEPNNFLYQINRILSPKGLARLHGGVRLDLALEDKMRYARRKGYLMTVTPNSIITIWKPGTPDFREYEIPAGGTHWRIAQYLNSGV